MLSHFRHIDWILLLALIPITGAGLISMYVFVGENDFFERQIFWVGIALAVCLGLSLLDLRALRKTQAILTLYLSSIALLLALFSLGSAVSGAQSWFQLGLFSIQPAEPMKLVLILLLAKYFSRRHVEIAHWKHIFISGFYALIPFLLVLIQPDFGSAIILFAIWFGMTVVSGISKKHLLLVFLAGALAFLFLWFFAFAPYQKERIKTFVHPLTDVRGAGYNAHQSTIAVGSGEFLGKGIGYGTQSRLKFLPQYQTDFIFASFAEEWGFVGVLLLLLCFGIVIWRVLHAAFLGASNFETLFALGLAIFFMTQLTIHVGMNMGLLPVTGQTLPFMSYGGSHLLTEFAGLGILMGMRRYERVSHAENMKNEFFGI
ncbi:MAG: rod shape-determining protein RodA [Candidatus Lloydbacteria bacterium RIFCSPHIGHO2_02_FULL_54_17]|uniref:Rod shape-determining protein RodA n=1 Tax=Candidatus Lloydbacteria bacterium RIFCSPHIGHO2_02_FULL_54_17 TaxID=1798664 RepID=A0A1G2DGQ7_9BACT|nr:MAG: rod shape-determining protein RodA [Candidatus Lloydbacteria bacterium RIFCSPHIGHO2_01_FULL_54_11]OGZ12151.1 MAG: rod shape-determining protein RodA [Candidatus Lloydbacteria bacterium RIFCSPHIGHO2_02_FULL_54_17]OGZ12941.1 MAG: rod shape-determining protein RodA [Candidatus Lloydbacteria bacterium RIFCSPLOWO2_01_FULL_54_18]OGZ15941.1 MAG: rod shape-determining protein RodA [Candidatus Lloydbacteria bacterium RIFCSPLOWO2_02_FULL_54_12]